MRNIVVSSFFEKKLKYFCTSHKKLKSRVERVISQLASDPFSTELKTHKLSGKLKGLYSCSIDYQYRLVFVFDKESIYLLNIGSHDEVY